MTSFVPAPDPIAPDSRICVVVAAAENWVIGAHGAMPWHLPEDLAHFKRITTGSAMVMGRRTFESIGRALPGRRSIVVTRDSSWSAPGAEAACSLVEAVKLAGSDRVTVVGGGQVYAQALGPDSPVVVDTVHLTQVHARPQGDTWFPPIDEAQWRQIACAEGQGCTFISYRRM
ncbi:Dihydrofolate reductase type 3 [Dermatophilus congolensis]|uniref:Dihydrofolate reductase n=1 Tax=Dermatophilus congolensis TaxID=1863 RepID=A0AA46BMM9_9MICO|nr:dihydrofolate reductase [Dermatophilus congolensis]STD07607.1 Dihydrofolate reductase type 3 [Dermatophilus congolensis]